LFYNSGFIAHINVNWLSPIKVRQTLIGGEKKMIVYNDLEPTEKVKIYNNGLSLAADEKEKNQMKIGYRLGDILTPHIGANEALNDMAAHFGDCINNGKIPLTDVGMGLSIVHILEAASQSMKENGKPVDLDFRGADASVVELQNAG